jgi:hypothetical protein
VPEQEADREQRPPEEGRRLLVHFLEGDQLAEVLLEAVPDQGEVLCDVVGVSVRAELGYCVLQLTVEAEDAAVCVQHVLL